MAYIRKDNELKFLQVAAGCVEYGEDFMENCI